MADTDVSPDLDMFQAQLGLAFRQPALLLQALTHPSFTNETNSTEDDNQRLEFLGDAILGLLVGEWLYKRYPQAREGELTSLRAHLVRTESLAEFARELDLGAYMRLGRGERASGGAQKDANICAAFEALVGAIYLDRHIARTRRWLHALLKTRASDIDEHNRERDHKSLLQEAIQGQFKVTPAYRIVRAEGPDHAKFFTSEVQVNGEVWGQGEGYSKQAAEQQAAAAALERLQSEGQTR